MHEHWTATEMEALRRVATFEETADIAIVILSRMKTLGQPIVQICGPMSTGGLGDLNKNLARFQKAIDVASGKGLTVFNQIPFQQVIDRIDQVSKNGQYCMDILEVFYRRVFESGHISKTLFLPDWQGSMGATWERNLVATLGIPFEEYPAEWLEEIEAAS